MAKESLIKRITKIEEQVEMLFRMVSLNSSVDQDLIKATQAMKEVLEDHLDRHVKAASPPNQEVGFIN